MNDLAMTPVHLAGDAFAMTLRAKATKLRDELIRQTLDDMASWERAVEAEMGRTHPELRVGTRTYLEEVQTFRERVPQDFAWVLPTFEAFLTPDPDATNPAIDTLGTIRTMFDGEPDSSNNWTGTSPALTRINTVRAEMVASWRGQFTNNFIDHFVDPLQTVLPNQRNLAQLVQEQLICSKILYIRRRQSVLDLIDNATLAVQNLTGRYDAAGVGKWATIAAIALGTSLGPFVTGLGLLSAIMLDAGGTILQGLVPDGERAVTKMELAGYTAAEVAAKVTMAISALERDTYEQERLATDALRAISQALENMRRPAVLSNTSGPFSVATPALVSATPAELIAGLHPNN